MAARAISNAAPMMRMVSGSNFWSPRNGVIGMDPACLQPESYSTDFQCCMRFDSRLVGSLPTWSRHRDRIKLTTTGARNVRTERFHRVEERTAVVTRSKHLFGAAACFAVLRYFQTRQPIA